MSLRGDIERAVIVTLAPLLRTNGGYLRALGHYNGEIDASKDGLDAMHKRLLGQQPAVLVTTSRRAYDMQGMRRERAKVSLELFLVVVSAHLRSPEARVLGAGAAPEADPGIYQILEDCQDRLWGADLGVIGAGKPRPVSEVFIAQVPEMSAWRAHYEIEHDARRPAPVGLPAFESLEHRHNLEHAEAVNPVVVGELPPEVS